MKETLLKAVARTLAVAMCGAAAWALSLVQWSNSSRTLVPFAFLGIILLFGLLYGRGVAIVGSIVAAMVFAHSLYQPVGSLRVTDQASRSSLAWMLLAGVSLSFLLLPSGGARHHGEVDDRK